MSPAALIESFVLGMAVMSSPCVLPLYPGYLAYLASRQEIVESRVGRYLLGVCVLGGVLAMMVALGLLLALLSISIGKALAYLIPGSSLLLLVLGGLLLLNINPLKRAPQLRSPVLRSPYGNAFIYGLFYGPVALPCSGPLVVSIFAIALTLGDALSKLATFLAFGMGFGLPLLLLSLLSGATQRWITRQLALHAPLINRVGGLLLIVIGLANLYTNQELLLAFWG
jgi:cytochrome c-type biogenesis protein